LPDYHKKGIMSEALTAVLQFSFDQLNLQTLLAFTNLLNKDSQSLLLKHHFSLEEGRKDENNAENIIFSLNRPETD
jgi:ribosomal-protein-alanine N-acetyltransferase